MSSRPTQEQLDEVFARWKDKRARSIMDACNQVCTTDLNFRALLLLAEEELKDRWR